MLAKVGPHQAVHRLAGGDLFDPSTGVTEEAYVLHDLASVILGKPVYKMMGAKGPTKSETYSGAIYME